MAPATERKQKNTIPVEVPGSQNNTAGVGSVNCVQVLEYVFPYATDTTVQTKILVTLHVKTFQKLMF